jgi:hypothetical protein
LRPHACYLPRSAVVWQLWRGGLHCWTLHGGGRGARGWRETVGQAAWRRRRGHLSCACRQRSRRGRLHCCRFAARALVFDLETGSCIPTAHSQAKAKQSKVNTNCATGRPQPECSMTENTGNQTLDVRTHHVPRTPLASQTGSDCS